MIRVVMFDLGDTLVDAQGQPLPHVEPALQAIMAMRTDTGRPLSSCLVSDHTLATPPLSAAKVKPLFDAYLERLDATGLRPWFEPVSRRVTLSTHVGVFKPDRRVFDKALQRLKSSATLRECLFITENAAHLAAARQQLGMQALRFRSTGAAGHDFDDWADAPALVARLLEPGHDVNLRLAATARLAALDVELESMHPTPRPDCWTVTGQRWCPLRVPGHDELGTLHVTLPVQATLQRGPGGLLRAELPPPDPAQLGEAAAFAASLAAQGQIATSPAARGATHAIEPDAAGRRRLVRKRFSAL